MCYPKLLLFRLSPRRMFPPQFNRGQRVWIKCCPPRRWTCATIIKATVVPGPLGTPTYSYELRDDDSKAHAFYEMTLRNFAWLHNRR